jgi:hypothetical protein
MRDFLSMQISASGLRVFDGFPKKGAGSATSGQPVAFRTKALKARDRGAAQLPTASALRSWAPAGGGASAADIQQARAEQAKREEERRRGLERRAWIVLKGMYFRWARGTLDRKQCVCRECGQRRWSLASATTLQNKGS